MSRVGQFQTIDLSTLWMCTCPVWLMDSPPLMISHRGADPSSLEMPYSTYKPSLQNCDHTILVSDAAIRFTSDGSGEANRNLFSTSTMTDLAKPKGAQKLPAGKLSSLSLHGAVDHLERRGRLWKTIIANKSLERPFNPITIDSEVNLEGDIVWHFYPF